MELNSTQNRFLRFCETTRWMCIRIRICVTVDFEFVSALQSASMFVQHTIQWTQSFSSFLKWFRHHHAHTQTGARTYTHTNINTRRTMKRNYGCCDTLAFIFLFFFFFARFAIVCVFVRVCCDCVLLWYDSKEIFHLSFHYYYYYYEVYLSFIFLFQFSIPPLLRVRCAQSKYHSFFFSCYKNFCRVDVIDQRFSLFHLLKFKKLH